MGLLVGLICSKLNNWTTEENVDQYSSQNYCGCRIRQFCFLLYFVWLNAAKPVGCFIPMDTEREVKVLKNKIDGGLLLAMEVWNPGQREGVSFLGALLGSTELRFIKVKLQEVIVLFGSRRGEERFDFLSSIYI